MRVVMPLAPPYIPCWASAVKKRRLLMKTSKIIEMHRTLPNENIKRTTADIHGER
jgi:hypothetical protein